MKVLMQIRWAVILFIMMFLCKDLKSQFEDKEGWIMYERGFNFQKGIYFSFEEFQNDSPGKNGEFQIKNGVMNTYNDSLQKMAPLRKQHWGYSDGKSIYIRSFNGYTRIGIIGALSYFGVTGSFNSGPSVGIATGGAVGIGVGSPNNSTIEYVLDFVSGQFYVFNKKGMEAILKARDPELFQQYKSYKGPKKGKIHLFLNAYNDRHPIFFPEH